MMKRLLLLFVLLPFMLQAAWLTNEPVTITQPDGTVLHCFATGDEFYNWLHDAAQFTIIQSQEDGYFYYAMLENDELVPSTARFGDADPAQHGLEPGLNISAAKRTEIRTRLEKEMRLTEMNGAKGKAEGELNNIVIYIRFSDQTEFSRDTIVNYMRFNDDTSNASSVLNYFREVSYEQLSVHSTFYPVPETNIIRSYQDDKPRAYYMPYNSVTNPEGYQNDNQRTQREHTLLANAVIWINEHSPVPEYIDLDYNNDGYVDNVVFIIRGAPTAWSTLLWPHRWSLYTKTVYINGKQVWDFNFQLETNLESGAVGVLCHELFHTLGAPDLYRYTESNITPVGPWDIMAADNNPPQYMGAFMKLKYGKWLETIPWITESGTYTINPLSSETNNSYRIASQFSSSEYFLVEYRKKEGTFEGTLPKSGLLIYRINPSAGNGNASGPPDEVYIFRPNGTPNQNGNLTDAVFGANYGRTEFGDDSNPYPFLQNGNLGGVYISDISAAGTTMSFKVDFPAAPTAALEVDITNACVGDVIQLSDASTGLPSSWNWLIEPATVEFVQGTTSQSKKPLVKFTEEGTYTLSLHVQNSLGTDVVTMEDMITIGSVENWLEETFESGNFRDGSWMIENPDQDVSWELFPVSGNGGEWAAGVNFRNYFAILERDRLISKPFDLSDASPGIRLTFEHAYALNQASTQYSDSLIVLASTDCGESWMRLISLGEDGSGNFATHEPTAEAFFPTVAEDWCGNGWGSPCLSLDIEHLSGLKDVRFAFETVSFYGNPIIIDNIQFAYFEGNEERHEANSFNVFPNPANSILYLSSSNTNLKQYYEITDMSGKTMLKGSFFGTTSLDVQNHCTPGLYIVHLRNEKENQSFKIFIK